MAPKKMFFSGNLLHNKIAPITFEMCNVFLLKLSPKGNLNDPKIP